MAVQIGPYSNEYFQSLPNLTYARDMFQNVDGNELVKTTFKDLFVQHKMDRVFGLTLLHRHFDIPVDQLLVEYNGTSTPWNTDAGNGMEKPQPLIWGFDSNGHLTPTEFKYSNRQDNEMGQDELSFVAIFRELLQKKNLTKLFGLCIYPGDDFKGTCEITMNRANINLQPDDYPKGLQQTETAWFFAPGLWQRGCKCTCAGGRPHQHGVHVDTKQ